MTNLGIDMNPTARRVKGQTILIAMRSSSTLQPKCRRFKPKNLPAILADTKKKERIGRFKNGGRAWHKQGAPEEVRGQDFADKELGKVVPYGVYDITRNTGWVSVGCPTTRPSSPCRLSVAGGRRRDTWRIRRLASCDYRRWGR